LWEHFRRIVFKQLYNPLKAMDSIPHRQLSIPVKYVIWCFPD